jgi:Domain of unknown function (DUF4304)
MNSKEFKNLFGQMAKTNGFSSAFGGWYKQSEECIAVLELQKSNFGDVYLLNIKILIQGAFETDFKITKDLIKRPMGHIDESATPKYNSIFDFDEPMEDSVREEKLHDCFKNHIMPFTNKALTRAGIRKMAEAGETYLLPAVKEELEKLS